MTAATPKDAREALAQQVTDANLPRVKVYDHEPADPTAGISVTFSTAKITATDWLISARVYVTNTAPEQAQDDLDITTTAVEELLSPCPRADWEFGLVEDTNPAVFVATATVSYPREDF